MGLQTYLAKDAVHGVATGIEEKVIDHHAGNQVPDTGLLQHKHKQNIESVSL